jgi:hypothetical protein
MMTMLSQSCSAASGGSHADASTAESIIRLALSGVAETAVPVEKRRRCARAASQIVSSQDTGKPHGCFRANKQE